MPPGRRSGAAAAAAGPRPGARLWRWLRPRATLLAGAAAAAVLLALVDAERPPENLRNNSRPQRVAKRSSPLLRNRSRPPRVASRSSPPSRHGGSQHPQTTLGAALSSGLVQKLKAHFSGSSAPSANKQMEWLPTPPGPQDGTLFHVHASEDRSLMRPLPEKPPVLTFMMSVKAQVSHVELSLPVGYDFAVQQGKDRKSMILAGDTENEKLGQLDMKALAPHIDKIEVPIHEDPSESKHFTLDLKDGVPGLNKDLSDDKERVVWYLRVSILYSKASLGPDAAYNLKWHYRNTKDWDGSLGFQAPLVLGDWDCKYSDWEHWGECSARCGTGKSLMRRRILYAPPAGGTGKACDESLETSGECNTHACIWPVFDHGRLTKDGEEPKCTAECGGGVKVHRRHITGDQLDITEEHFKDPYALELEECGTQNCKVKCRHSAKWRAVTQCSELCGIGYFKLILEVVQKDPDDDSCMPIWRRQDCLRQRCGGFAVVHPNRNVLPMCGGRYQVAIVIDGSQIDHYKVRKTHNGEGELLKKLQLSAPVGFTFLHGEERVCRIFEADLPSPSCRVLPNEANKLEVVMDRGMHMPAKRQFWIEVRHPPCDQEKVKSDVGLNELYQVMEDSQWTLTLHHPGGIEQGSNQETIIRAPGYDLHYPTNFAPETWEYRDWTTCTGHLSISSGNDEMCVQHSEGKITLEKCPEGETSRYRWTVPPTGNGPIVLLEEDRRKCICVHGEPDRGSSLELSTCDKQDPWQKCSWYMPVGTRGEIRLHTNRDLCMVVISGTLGEGAELGLGWCGGMQWQTPCEGLPDMPDDPMQTSGVIVKRRPPQYCSARRHNCGEGSVCNLQTGVCDVVPR